MKKKLIFVMLAVIILLGMMPVSAAAVGEAGNRQASPEANRITTAADVDSRYDYREIFDLSNTRYDGRIWTDKTVLDRDMTFYGNVHEIGEDEIVDHTGSVTVGMDRKNGEDFLVCYSALAATTTVISETESPIDLVFVLDMSPMSNSAAGKLESMLDAVESASDEILKLNPNNRVAVVAYSSQAEVLLPLGHYDAIQMSPGTGEPSHMTTVTCQYTENGKSDTKNFTVSYLNGTPVNKYTQMGIYTGMKVLKDVPEKDLTVSVGNSSVRRQPAMILMSEGEPKIASTEIDNPTKSTVQPDGSIDTGGDAGLSEEYNAKEVFNDRVEIKRNNGHPDSGDYSVKNSDRHAQTFATILTAASMKKQVSEHYNTDAEHEMQIYTIGINTATANAPELAKIALDPKQYLMEDSAFKTYVDQFTGEQKTAVLPNAGIVKTSFKNNAEFTEKDLEYNDGYYDVIGKGNDIDWKSVFDLVLAQVTSNIAKVPTLVDKTDVHGDSSGYLDYMDPLGEYMEVKDVKALIIDDVIYRADLIDKTTNQEGISYKVRGTATNPVYGENELSKIIIRVTEKDGKQQLQVRIPAALLPLRQTTVTKDSDDNIIGYTHNSAYPFRLVYSAGLKDGVLNEEGCVDMSRVSQNYIAEHTDGGYVRFYEGYFSSGEQPGNLGNDGKTIGNAYTAYTPALDNPFYYVEEKTPLYADEGCTEPVNKSDKDTTDTYYFKINYYRGIENGSPDAFPAGEEQQLVVSRPASSIREQSLEYDPAGNLYLKQGAPRLGNLADFRKEKENQNNTGTADIYRYLYHVEDESVDGIHKFRIYQGNNGCLSAPLPKGTLSVKKEVENGEDAEISDFKFKIELPQDSQDVEHLKNQDGSGIDWDGNVGTFSLKKDETKVLALNPGTEWEITETTDYEGDWKDHWTNTVTAEPENGVTFDNLSAKGSMTAGGRTDVVFKSVHDTHTGTLTVSKEVDGDISASGTSQFTFTLITVSEDKTEKSETFTLGDSQSRSFKIEEGTRWTVEESDPGENWKTEIIGDTGVVTDPGNRLCTSGTMVDGEQKVTFKNTYTAPGSLVVSKRVEGDPDNEKKYQFRVTIGGKTEEPLYLKNGESETYENLSEGTEWSVEEVTDPGENWTTTVNGEEGKKIEGTIASGEISSASFVNRAPGTLIIKKTVSQGNGDENKKFEFKLKCKGTEHSFSLGNGEAERFELPAGTEYSVEEIPAEGWHVSIGGEEKNSFSGRILAGSEMTAEFVNSCEKSGTGPSQGGTAVKNTVLHYESNGGTKYEDESYRLNTSVTLDKVPVREGYTFTGWFEDEKLTRPVTEIRMTSDKTVYAGWKITGIPDRLDGRDHFAYIIGYTDGNVHPTANISRAEVATILFRLLDPEVRKQNLTTENIFDDVKPGMWYNTAVSTLSRMGIVKGRTGGLFDPDASITRAEFAAVCARFDDSGAEADSNFTDISGHWAKKEIARASVLGWIRGYSDGTFRPDNRITRAEAVTMINRVLQRLPESESDLLPDMNVWPDNRQTDWFYLPVQEATNSHDFERKNDGVHEHWTGMTEDPDWKQYEIAGNIS